MSQDRERADPFQCLLGRAQLVRVDAQELLEGVEGIQAAAELLDEKTRDREIERAVEEAGRLLTSKRLPEHQRKLQQLLEENCDVAERIGDETWRIHNRLREVADRWPTASDPDPSHQAGRAADALTALITEAAILTIPNRLKQHLDGIAVGKPLDFDVTFSDELPDSGERKVLLARLAAYERLFGGAVDVENGVVYKISRSRFWRVASYVSPLGFAILAGALLALIGTLDQLEIDLPAEWQLASVPPLIGAYLLVLTGVVAHLIVENIKQLQSEKVPILAIGDALEWLHLRWAGLALTFVPILVTVVGLRAFGVGNTPDELPIYVFAGYSVDSVAGLFLTRFDASARRQLKPLQEALSGSAETDDDAATPRRDARPQRRGRRRRRRVRRRR